MAQKTFQLTVARVDEPVFAGEAVSVQLPGIDGQMELLADHEPIISPLTHGTITITTGDGQTETHAIEAGTLEMSNNRATILI